MYTFAATCLENKEKIVFHFSLFYFRLEWFYFSSFLFNINLIKI